MGLSWSLTVTTIFSPPVGRWFPADVWALPKAIPNESSKPMTSPVDRISGPSSVSTSKRLNGNTASFTATPLTWGSLSTPRAAMGSPAITRAASRARGTPVALPTKGTVRDARGLTSST